MSKKLIIINGAMGVGKTTVCRLLNKQLDNSVWLDGDWCWMMNPFIVNEENKKMVIENITFLLRNFLNNSSLEHVILSWVIHQEDIFELILKGLEGLKFEVVKITLTCSEEALRKRVIKDIDMNSRDEASLNRSLNYLGLYKCMNTTKIDTSDIAILETAERIVKIITSA